jgi:hypothetical protein
MVDRIAVGSEDGYVLGDDDGVTVGDDDGDDDGLTVDDDDDGLTVGDDDGPVEVVLMITLPAHEPIAEL